MRTFVFAVIGLAFLLAGYTLSLIYSTAGVIIFSAYATGVGFIVLSVAGKHSVDSLSIGQGLEGLWKSLKTDAKPPGGPTPPPSP